jgi:hypothetical protein
LENDGCAFDFGKLPTRFAPRPDAARGPDP